MVGLKEWEAVQQQDCKRGLDRGSVDRSRSTAARPAAEARKGSKPTTTPINQSQERRGAICRDGWCH